MYIAGWKRLETFNLVKQNTKFSLDKKKHLISGLKLLIPILRIMMITITTVIRKVTILESMEIIIATMIIVIKFRMSYAAGLIWALLLR